MKRADYAVLRQMHAAQGIDYEFPDLDSPLFCVKRVREVQGRLTGALVLKLCAETALILGEQHPCDKMTTMRELQGSVLATAHAMGLDEIHAAIPAIGFDKRLRQLGWLRDRSGWQLWSRNTGGV